MKYRISLMIILSIVLTSIISLAADVEFLANDLSVRYGQNKIIVEAVKAQNSKGMSLNDIKALDEKWKKESGIADYMKAILDNSCSKELKRIQSESPEILEIFVMDNQGGIVGMTGKTSDYWQGDEAKFQRSYNNGNGSIFIDDPEFDDSVGTMIIQISVPVLDELKTIGAITFGVDLEQMK